MQHREKRERRESFFIFLVCLIHWNSCRRCGSVQYAVVARTSFYVDVGDLTWNLDGGQDLYVLACLGEAGERYLRVCVYGIVEVFPFEVPINVQGEWRWQVLINGSIHIGGWTVNYSIPLGAGDCCRHFRVSPCLSVKKR